MRVLLDSNVWLSVITARRGFCRRLWREIAKQCEVFSGRPVVREVEEKLEKKFRYSPKRAHRLAAFFGVPLSELLIEEYEGARPRIIDTDEGELVERATGMTMRLLPVGPSLGLQVANVRFERHSQPNQPVSFRDGGVTSRPLN